MIITIIISLEKKNKSLANSINKIENTIVKLQKIPVENKNKIKIKID